MYSTVSSILKELWSSELYNILSSHSLHHQTTSSYDHLISKRGIPVWLSEWFQCTPHMTSTHKHTTKNPLKKTRTSSRIHKKPTNLNQINLENDILSTWEDPHILIPAQQYGEVDACISEIASVPQPFTVYVHPQVSLLCDIHSHLSDAEVIGLLAGRWDPIERCIYIQTACPCDSTERIDDDGSTDVEMDPTAELVAREAIHSMGLMVVGWYHSHPSFRPDPSTTDVINQRQYQQLMRDETSGMEPFVGLIVSTYDPSRPGLESLHQWFHAVPFSCASRAAACQWLPMTVRVCTASVCKSLCPISGQVSPDIASTLSNRLLSLNNKSSDGTSLQGEPPQPNGEISKSVEKEDSSKNELPDEEMTLKEADVSVGLDRISGKSSRDETEMSPSCDQTETKSVEKEESSRNELSNEEMKLKEADVSVGLDRISGKSSRDETEMSPSCDQTETNRAPDSDDSVHSCSSLEKDKKETSIVKIENTSTREKEQTDCTDKSTDATDGEKEQTDCTNESAEATDALKVSSSPEGQKMPLRRSRIRRAPRTFYDDEVYDNSIRVERTNGPTDATLTICHKVKDNGKDKNVAPVNGEGGRSKRGVKRRRNGLGVVSTSGGRGRCMASLIQCLQQETSAAVKGRTLVCSAAPILQCSCIGIVALGYHYSQSKRKTNILKKWKNVFKYSKIKASICVWLKYMGLSESDQELFADSIVDFLNSCWRNE